MSRVYPMRHSCCGKMPACPVVEYAQEGCILKKAMQQLAWAIMFGLGIPGLILGVTAEAKHMAGGQKGPSSQPPAWTAPMDSTISEVASP